MKIAAFVSHPIQYFTPLWRELSERPGVELTVFYFARQGLEVAEDPGFGVRFAWDIDLLAGHKHRFLPRRWPTRDPLEYGPRGLNRGLWAALDEGWDAVYLGGYAHANNWFIAARCKQRGIPVLCFGDTTSRTELGRPLWRRAVKQVPLRSFVRQVGAFLAAGGQARDYFVRYGAALESVFICPYSVDVGRFRETVERAGPAAVAELRERWGIAPEQRIAMFCGKLAPWKRPADLLAAVRVLDRPNLVAVLVGDGELRAELQAQGGARARCPGFVNQSEIPIVLSAADVLVLPSSYEPYGMVVSEAQCLGVPAIVSDACGCHGEGSVLQDGVSGFVYPAGDVRALVQRLARLLDDRELCERMRLRARERGETQSQARAADAVLSAAQYALR